MPKLHIASGVIVAVQEERFRMVTETGQNLLLTLHNLAPLPAELGDLWRAQSPVRVAYEGEPNLTSGVVRRIDLI